MKNAIILCSGGLDSTVTSYYVKEKLKYGKIKILFFNYKQKSILEERKFSKKCALNLNADFEEIKLYWIANISNSLINKDGKVKKIKRSDLKNTNKVSKKFYVPCRNTIFLTYALALAESIWVKSKENSDIFVGFKCEGNDSYPDTTKEFVLQMNKLSKIGCSNKFRIIAPLINKDKEDIIMLGKKLGIDFKDTFSCYIPKKGKHCGICLACKLRQEGFHWTNIKDPTYYEN